ncbi:hypothetical protein VN97_g2699 [Penicillium thymicola]|uniref:Gamma-glutamylcyclotransferase AIG2-like domain-containing protein n=1 Tax=Penicillium thymicola TaxID=293382 RepID=A0AAI9TP26_PENTH|nr:hypothetical protein VN97_g2699 [Penicillium thymicola]
MRTTLNSSINLTLPHTLRRPPRRPLLTHWIIGYEIKLLGPYPALVDKPLHPVDGMVCGLLSPTKLDRLAAYETDKSDLQPCLINVLNNDGSTEETIEGVSFMWNGRQDELREDFSIAHKWAQAPGPQPINGGPSKPIQSPFLCPNIVLARIKSIFFACTNLYIQIHHTVIHEEIYTGDYVCHWHITLSLVITYNSLSYTDSPTPKLAAKRSANFPQIHFRFTFRFTSDSIQI